MFDGLKKTFGRFGGKKAAESESESSSSDGTDSSDEEGERDSVKGVGSERLAASSASGRKMKGTTTAAGALGAVRASSRLAR
jgi:hypothetical protein